MTAPTDIQSLVGARVYISATRPETFDAAGYQSTDLVWTEIEPIESIGPFGGNKQVSNFMPVKTGHIDKVGGSTDYGNMTLVLGAITMDAGQTMLKTAFGLRNTRYSAKVVYDDGGASVTDEVQFFDVLVTQFERQNGDANAVRKINVTLAICKEPVIVDPT